MDEIEKSRPVYNREISSEEPAEAKIGPFGRLFGVLLSPGETFADINRKPTWVVALIISIVISTGFWLFFNWRVKPDWRVMIRKQIEHRMESSNTSLTPEQIDDQVDKAAGFTKYFTYVGALLFPLIGAFAISGLFAIGMMFIQAQTTYKKVLSVYAWTSCAMTLVTVVVTCASLMARDPASLSQIDMNGMRGLTATNLAVFLPDSSSAVLKSLAGSLDLFTIWTVILLIVGLAAIGGSKRVTKGKTAGLVISLWVIWILLKVGFASIGFGG